MIRPDAFHVMGKYRCCQQTDSGLNRFWETRLVLNQQQPAPMPRKAAAAPATAGSSSEPSTEPRRSSRIKEQPKPEPAPKKAAAKPKAKKADKEDEDVEEKPKAPRSKKRKADDEAPNGESTEAAEPPAKKVRHFFSTSDVQGADGKLFPCLSLD